MSIPCPWVMVKDLEDRLLDRSIQLLGYIRERGSYGYIYNNYIQYVDTFQRASEIIMEDNSIWRISFTINNVRYRLIREVVYNHWRNKPNESDEEVSVPDDLRRVLNEVGITV